MSHRKNLPVYVPDTASCDANALSDLRRSHYLWQTAGWIMVATMLALFIWHLISDDLLPVAVLVIVAFVAFFVSVKAGNVMHTYEQMKARSQYLLDQFEEVRALAPLIERPMYTIKVESLEYDNQLQLTITPINGMYRVLRYIVTPTSTRVVHGPRLGTLLPVIEMITSAGDTEELRRADASINALFVMYQIDLVSQEVSEAIELQGD